MQYVTSAGGARGKCVQEKGEKEKEMIKEREGSGMAFSYRFRA